MPTLTKEQAAALGRRQAQPTKAPGEDAGEQVINPMTYPLRLAKDRIAAHCVLPGEPMSKSRPRFNRKTRSVYTPRETVERERAIGLLVKSQMREMYADEHYAFGLRVVFYVKNSQRKDVDNMVKLLVDGMNGVAWKDDRQLWEIMAWRIEQPAAPRTELVVYRLLVPFEDDARRCLACDKPFRAAGPTVRGRKCRAAPQGGGPGRPTSRRREAKGERHEQGERMGGRFWSAAALRE